MADYVTRINGIIDGALSMDSTLKDLKDDYPEALDSLYKDHTMSQFEICTYPFSLDPINDTENLIGVIQGLEDRLNKFKEGSWPEDESLRILRKDGIKSLLKDTCQLINDTIRNGAKDETPSHIKDLNFDGVKTIEDNPEQYVFLLSDTDPAYVMMRKIQDDPVQCGPSDSSHFVVGVINGEAKEPFSDRTVSYLEERDVSLHDNEVFDTIQNLGRMGSFELGMVTVASQEYLLSEGGDFVKDSYDLSSNILNYCIAEKPKSLTLTFISDLSSIEKKGQISELIDLAFADIIDNHQSEEGEDVFKELKDICIDVVSCTTTEIATELLEKINGISSSYPVNIKLRIYGGYLHNNNSFCYTHNALLDNVKKALEDRAAAGEENPQLTYADAKSQNKELGTLISDNPFKSGKNTEVQHLGITITKPSLEEGSPITDIIAYKRLMSKDRVRQESESSEGSEGSAGSAGSAGSPDPEAINPCEIRKKLLKPGNAQSPNTFFEVYFPSLTREHIYPELDPEPKCGAPAANKLSNAQLSQDTP